MSSVESLSLKSSLAFLNGLLDISISLVVLGLIFEFAPRLWSRFFGGAPHHHIEKLGEVLVILGVAGELALHIRSGQIEEKIKSSQREEIISLRTGEAKLTCENNALREVLAPRILAPGRRATRRQLDPSAEMFKQKLPGPGVVVKLQAAADPDAQALLVELQGLLNELESRGWKALEVDEKESGFLTSLMREGISIYSNLYEKRPDEKEAGMALAAALQSSLPNGGVEGWVRPMPPQLGVTGPRFSDTSSVGFIYVAIGMRPVGITISGLKSRCADPKAIAAEDSPPKK